MKPYWHSWDRSFVLSPGVAVSCGQDIRGGSCKPWKRSPVMGTMTPLSPGATVPWHRGLVRPGGRIGKLNTLQRLGQSWGFLLSLGIISNIDLCKAAGSWLEADGAKLWWKNTALLFTSQCFFVHLMYSYCTCCVLIKYWHVSLLCMRNLILVHYLG